MGSLKNNTKIKSNVKKTELKYMIKKSYSDRWRWILQSNVFGYFYLKGSLDQGCQAGSTF